MEDNDLSEDDILGIIDAANEMGGEQAMIILEKMKTLYVDKFPEAEKEIEIFFKPI